MNNRDQKLIEVADFPAAMGLLTRLPVPVSQTRAVARGAAAAWAYPLAGALIGIILAATVSAFTWIGLPIGIVAALVIGVNIIITGAMHEDGLADSADGLWGGWDRARRLEIMKDSHIGTYGVLALALSLLIRWLGLSALIALDIYWAGLVAIAVLSRGGMVVLMAAMKNARDTGLSKSVGRPTAATAWVTIAIAVLIAALLGQFAMIVVAPFAVLACGLIARTKIGGQTGDILGATQQITEMTLLLVVLT
ncbi:adenosylcobinamide-GDP ribazoletransferase [Loktanella sp. D2R18]|uniref:adenosylcobinamide-GDP ribazoletransferase n=1 Tax=Rhodobacterales TaxID=204455 RepID=UPI000DE8FAC7|nr:MULTISPECIES: adenosylcobinamide-GDP ribazoletransferase [Rhodobacterales]MDO6591715.1 adenosylcobinamide-GDP ribazoletransferase [Yoonia sp. 1_MG-2023]RBW42538.1 adenosylcobinamide-GDP ribazoletransferase [Loktanella sp. D2R18]